LINIKKKLERKESLKTNIIIIISRKNFQTQTTKMRKINIIVKVKVIRANLYQMDGSF